MGHSRREAILAVVGAATLQAQRQDPNDQERQLPIPPDPGEDRRLPNGKSMKDEMAKRDHQQALKDADDLISAAKELKGELEKAGDYVVPVSTLKKTEEIEKLARRIRGRLKQ